MLAYQKYILYSSAGGKKLLKEGLNIHPIQKKMLIFFFWDANTLKGSWIRRCWCAGNNRCLVRAGKAGKEIAKRISGERSQTKKLVITGLSFFFCEQEAPSYQSATQLTPFFQDLPSSPSSLSSSSPSSLSSALALSIAASLKLTSYLSPSPSLLPPQIFLQFISTIWKVITVV